MCVVGASTGFACYALHLVLFLDQRASTGGGGILWSRAIAFLSH
jgi:hypothetical protein